MRQIKLVSLTMPTCGFQRKPADRFLVAALLFLCFINLYASPAERARNAFETARVVAQNETNNFNAAWKFGRASFDWAEFAKTSKERAHIAEQGIASCRRAIALQPKDAAGHYYLAMNLGQLARTKTLGALRIVREIESEFQIADKLDESFDHAGPARNLGLLYLEAPGWPTSIGNKASARKHLSRAVYLAPSYPENRLCLIETLLRWGDKTEALKELKILSEHWAGAKLQFTGADWEDEWRDWDARLHMVQHKLKQ